MGDSVTTTQDLLAQHQILETFKGLAPLLGQVTLTPNPREPKRSKTQHVLPAAAGCAQCSKRQRTHSRSWWTWWKQLSLLVLRHERELNMCRRTDSFVLFFNKDPKGGLSSILTATQKSAGTAQDHPSSLWRRWDSTWHRTSSPICWPEWPSCRRPSQRISSFKHRFRPTWSTRKGIGRSWKGPQCSLEPGEKQQEAHQHEPDVTVLPGTSGSVSQPGLGSMLPVPAEQCECNSQSSAAPTEFPGQIESGNCWRRCAAAVYGRSSKAVWPMPSNNPWDTDLRRAMGRGSTSRTTRIRQHPDADPFDPDACPEPLVPEKWSELVGLRQ